MEERTTLRFDADVGNASDGVNQLLTQFGRVVDATGEANTAMNAFGGAARELGGAAREFGGAFNAALSQVTQNAQNAGNVLRNELSAPRNFPGFRNIGEELGNIQQGARDVANSIGEFRNALPHARDLTSIRDLSNSFRNIQERAQNASQSILDVQEAVNRRIASMRGTLSGTVTGRRGGRARDGLDFGGMADISNIRGSSQDAWNRFTADAQRRAAQAGVAGGRAFSDNFNANMNFSQSMGSARIYLANLMALFTARAVSIGANFVRTLTSSLNVGGGFESQMTSVKVISGATADELDALTNKAREMGATLPITAQQAAAAMQVLAQRGTKARDILANVANVSNLVVSQGMDMAAAAELIGSTMTNFGIAVEEAGRITDVFNNAANQSALSAATLQTSMNYVAPAAAAAGLSLEETVASMEVLANAGLDASMVGTGMAMVLQKLAGETYVLGVRVKDAEGNMRPLREIFTEIQARGMTLAEATTIFGARASKAALNLMKYSNTLGDLENNLRKAGSTSAAVEEKMTTWTNTWNSFQSAAESVHITIFDQIKEQSKTAVSGLADVTRGLKDWISNTKVAEKATNAFIKGLGFNVDFKGMLEGLDVRSVVNWFQDLGKTVQNVFNAIGTAFNVLKRPLSVILDNLGKIALLFAGNWIRNASIGIGSLVNAFTGLSTSVSGAAGALGMFSNFLTGLPVVATIGALTWAFTAFFDTLDARLDDIKKFGKSVRDAMSLNEDGEHFVAAMEALKAGDKAEFEFHYKLVDDTKLKGKLDEKAEAKAESIKENLTNTVKAFNESLKEGEEHLKIDDADLKDWGSDIENALHNRLESIDWMPESIQALIHATAEAMGIELKYAKAIDETSKAEWRATKASEEAERTRKRLQKEQFMGAGKTEAQSELSVQFNARFDSLLKETNDAVEKAKDLLGDAELELVINANAEDLQKKIDEIAGDISKEMKIPKNVALEGIVKEIDAAIAAGKDASGVLKKTRDNMKPMKAEIEKYISKAQDAIKYFGAAPASVLPTLNAMLAKVDKFDEFGKVTEEFKMLRDTMNEMASASISDFAERARDAVEYMGALPSKFLPAFDNMAKGIKKVDDWTGKVKQSYKEAKKALQDWINVSFDNLKNKIETIKKAVERGLVDQKVLDRATEDAVKEIKIQVYAEAQADREQKRAQYSGKGISDAEIEQLVQADTIVKYFEKLGALGENVLKKEEAKFEKGGAWRNQALENDMKRLYEDAQMQAKQEEARLKQTAKQKPATEQEKAQQGAMSEANVIQEALKGLAATTGELKTAASGQTQAALDFSGNVTAVQTSVTTIVTRLGQMEKTIQDNTQALREAKTALTNGGKVDAAKTTATKAAPETAKEAAVKADETPSSLEVVLGELKTAIENMGKPEATGEVAAEAKATQPATDRAPEQPSSLEALIRDNSQTLTELKGVLSTMTAAKTEQPAEMGAAKADTSAVQSEFADVVNKLIQLEESIKGYTQAINEAKTAMDNAPKAETGGTDAGKTEAAAQITPAVTVEQPGTLDALIRDNTQALIELRGALSAIATAKTEQPAETVATQPETPLFGDGLSRLEAAIAENARIISAAVGAQPSAGTVAPEGETTAPADGFTAIGERISSLEAALLANTQALNSARDAATATASAGVAEGASAPAGQETDAQATAILAQLETIAANTQALGSASAAITELASRSANTGETAQGGDVTKAVESLGNVERSISEHTQALRAATTELSKISVSNSGGDVTINLQDFTVRQESDIQRIKQIVLDALRSAGLMRPGLGMGTV